MAKRVMSATEAVGGDPSSARARITGGVTYGEVVMRTRGREVADGGRVAGLREVPVLDVGAAAAESRRTFASHSSFVPPETSSVGASMSGDQVLEGRGRACPRW